MTVQTSGRPARLPGPALLWLDLTRVCQLECVHCLNSSGPRGKHGSMSREQWQNVLTDAAASGTSMVQMFGGEPSLHPDFPILVEYALALGLEVEVYTNLVHVTDRLWTLYRAPGLRLATSYYGARPDDHNAVTRRPSHARTRANIVKALASGVPLRAGVIDTGVPGAAESAREELERLGVRDVRVDRVRAAGRGAGAPHAGGLCGRCGQGRAAVGPDGDVTPCPFASGLVAGNVRAGDSLAAIVSSGVLAQSAAAVQGGGDDDDDDPDEECSPGFPGSSCTPRN
ncbi:radical SAM/SPASM domain-containing protein [Streptomyces sp. NPDC002018]|uniref:radical SAM/SPASM domain-containing protein n=1 Tax=Streptomyces sp. NPDC002018 TaxID=3364629 RepID=UPI0036950CFD